MPRATISVDPAFRVGQVDPRLFGSFVEHMGRCVYTGIYEPEHSTADDNGFRGDVAELVGELGVPVLRYPGGNFVSGYRWEDGIGPRAERPTRLDLAWHSTETNAVGTDDFIGWARRVGSEPMLAVNLGTRGVDAARNLVEYCNHPSGTYWSDLRRKNGAADPHDVRLWCLGNEMDGPWQIGHKTAEEYGRLAAETAKAMKLVDQSIELVACGSSNARMPTFGSWEATVLEETYEHVEYISMHTYYEERHADRDSFLACAMDMDSFIEGVVATADAVRAKHHHRKRINISFDEWNVWYMSQREPLQDWEVAPRLIEDSYNVVDAVVVGNLLISLLRHADRVKVGCLAQLVNVIAPIRSERGGPAWRQTIFHPFALTSRHGRGTALTVLVDSPRYETSWFGDVPVLDATAVQHEDTGEVTVFAVNRSQTESLAVEIDTRALSGVSTVEHTWLADEDREARNTADQPDRVRPQTKERGGAGDGKVEVALPACSWNMVRLLP